MKELQVSTAPIEINDSLQVNLPLELTKYLKLKKKDKTLFFVLTNGVIQISARKPHADIPVFVKDNNNFIPQK